MYNHTVRPKAYVGFAQSDLPEIVNYPPLGRVWSPKTVIARVELYSFSLTSAPDYPTGNYNTSPSLPLIHPPPRDINNDAFEHEPGNQSFNELLPGVQWLV